MTALVAVMVTIPAFKLAVANIRALVIAPSGTGHVRPTAAGSVSAWFGQQAAARAHDDTMLIPSSADSIRGHVLQAIGLEHPLSQPGSRLPADVKDAIAWVASKGTQVPILRQERLQTLADIHRSLAAWNDKLWNEGAVAHVRAMHAYEPSLAFIHACVVALQWPHADLVIDMAVGAATVGAQPDTGVWRHDPPKEECGCFEDLKPSNGKWNEQLYSSVRAEGLKPTNQAIAWAAWQRTQDEVAVGWCTPVVGGYAELNSRFGENYVRLMRRFGVSQGDKCRCCDSATASGHNPCTSFEERLVNVRADFPMEAAAQFAVHMEIDGSWTMHVATNDVVAAFRRVACADPSTTIVAQWDPRPANVGGQRVKLFYVQGFNFGLKSAVMAYNAVAEFQTRAAVRLLPVVACHYFDDFCCAEPDFSCDSAQQSLERFMHLTGLDLGGVVGRDNILVTAKRQTPSWVRKFLGVVTDFTQFFGGWETCACTCQKPKSKRCEPWSPTLSPKASYLLAILAPCVGSYSSASRGVLAASAAPQWAHYTVTCVPVGRKSSWPLRCLSTSYKLLLRLYVQETYASRQRAVQRQYYCGPMLQAPAKAKVRPLWLSWPASQAGPRRPVIR